MNEMQALLCTTLQSVDSWSATNWSYIGVTAHWIDAATVEDLRRVVGCAARTSSMYSPARGRMSAASTSTGIIRKVNVTTIDNGSNFVKAFSVFGPREGGDDGSSRDDDDDDAAVFTDAG